MLYTIKTLLCWEKSGIDETLKRWQETGKWYEKRPFCHRNLAIKLVEKFRPDCYGLSKTAPFSWVAAAGSLKLHQPSK